MTKNCFVSYHYLDTSVSASFLIKSLLSPCTAHLLGEYPRRGCKTREIGQKTNGCSINLSHYSSKNQRPMVITIKSSPITSSAIHDVRKAKRMITASLLEFLCDENSDRRLIYDLALTSTGTFILQKADNGTVQQECQNSRRLIWMKALGLPMSNFHGKKLIPHGRFLVQSNWQQKLRRGTSCDIEVYGFNHSEPMLANPYVLICGDNSHDVTEVAGRVEEALFDHHQKCEFGCQFMDHASLWK